MGRRRLKSQDHWACGLAKDEVAARSSRALAARRAAGEVRRPGQRAAIRWTTPGWSAGPLNVTAADAI